ncbi:MAG: uroporphyrinogen decarboxylase family protein [Saccharofermentanales bacterium]
MLTNRERYVNVLNFKPVDRMPLMEWAIWWGDRTIKRWEDEGLPKSLDAHEIYRYFGLDDHHQTGFSLRKTDFPSPKSYGAPLVTDEKDYDELKKYLFPEDAVSSLAAYFKSLGDAQQRGEYPVWMTTEGYFWYPRTLLGIQGHLFAFYDYPELYHRICSDVVDFQIRMTEQLCDIVTPDFMTFAEDMSYNHGPMLSKELFDEFLAPYYKKIVPVLKQRGVKVIIDTDGNVMPMIPWLQSVGIDGVLPLERQSGVDVAHLRKLYPDLLMIGGYDKMVMKNGREAMRAEFERLLPVMKSGGYIASVDHQTPPDVSIENYRIYIELYREYSLKATIK